MKTKPKTMARRYAAVVALPLLLFALTPSSFANAANPLPTTGGTATTNADGSVTVVVHGNWDWQSQTGTEADPCGGTRYGVGWAIAWGDPNQPGNPVTKGSITLLVGTPSDNTVHFNAADPCGSLGAGNHPTGAWGPDSHTYAAGTTIGKVCVNMYDLHDTQAKKPGDYIAGGSGHNSDNSVQTNSFDPNSAGYCFQPTVGTQVPAGAMGLVVFIGVGLLLAERHKTVFGPRR
jgi:hypothetical protein